MSASENANVPVWPYVLIVAVVKAACGALAYWYTTQTGHQLGNLGTPVSFLSAGVAVGWYSHRVNRPMQRGELVRFASGAALVDLALSCVVLLGPIIWVGEPLSLRNVDLVLGGNGTQLTPEDLIWLGGLAVFVTLMTFVLSLFVAWLITRKLPRRREKMSEG
jgi:hypothetical protein